MTKSAVTVPPNTASAHSSNNKIEKLQNIIETGLFRPKTEFSRTSIFFPNNTKSARSSKFRTDILIEELEKLIKDLQEFLKVRLSSNQIDASQGNNSILELKKKLDLHIVKYEIVKKLNVELNYARNALEEAIKQQGDIGMARKRAAWLEDKIESIILSENEISFPMQAQLMNDSSLKVRRIEKSINDSEKTDDSFENFYESSCTISFGFGSSQSDMQFGTERDINTKSRCSTDSLISLIQDIGDTDINQNFLKFRRRRSSMLTHESQKPRDQQSPDDSNDYYSISIKSTTDSKKNRKVSISDTEPNINVYDDNCYDFTDEGIAEKVEENLLNKKNNLVIDVPHRRFEWSPFVKTLYELDSTTFHQLGISIRDSYIENDDEIDPQLPWLKNKKDLEPEDYECIETANKIDALYKKICKTSIESTLPHKKDSFTPVLVPSNKEPISTRAKRLIKSYKRPDEDESTLPKKTDTRLGSTFSHHYVFFPHPITPCSPYPLTRTNTNAVFPRSPKVYADIKSSFESKSFTTPRRLVNQRNLKEESRLKLYRPKIANTNSIISDPSIVFYDTEKRKESMMKNELSHSINEANKWKNIKPKSSPAYHDGLKFERIRALLSTNIKSQSADERMDAIRHLGMLRAGDAAVAYTLQSVLENKDESELLKLESAKSLVLLGYWRDNVFNYMIKYLKYGNVDMQIDLLKTIINGKNIQFIDKDAPGFEHFNRVLEELTYHRDDVVSLDASICLGKLGIIDSDGAQTKLKDVINNGSDWVKKTLALEVYIIQFNIKNNETLEDVLFQLRKAPMWPSRAAAARLMTHLGQSICCTRENIEKVYDSLENRLCEDPIKEVRLIITETMKSLQLYNRVISRMTKNLESQDEEIRAKAVIALDTLAVKRSKVIHILVEMLELDGSDHVRILIIKTLLHLAPNDKKVIIAFDQLEKSSHLNAIIKKLRSEVKN